MDGISVLHDIHIIEAIRALGQRTKLALRMKKKTEGMAASTLLAPSETLAPAGKLYARSLSLGAAPEASPMSLSPVVLRHQHDALRRCHPTSPIINSEQLKCRCSARG